MYVDGIRENLTEIDLNTYFGQVNNVTIIRDSSESINYSFVQFKDHKTVELALSIFKKNWI